jgi:glucokinase
MTDDISLDVPASGSKGRMLLVGGLIGAVTGMGVAYLISQRAERQGGEVSFSPGEGLRLGLLVLGMLRQVADLASPDQD